MQFLGDTADNAFDLASPARIENSAILGATFAGEGVPPRQVPDQRQWRSEQRDQTVDGSIGFRAEW